MENHLQWLTFLQQLQGIAQAGLAYPGDKYDKERFQQLRDLTAEAMANISGFPTQCVKNLFCNETGFQTPKIDTRAVILNEANEIHKYKYNYSKVQFNNLHDKVVIICPIHGEFLQEAQSHLQGCRCPKCNRSSHLEDDVRYLLNINNIIFEEQKT